MYQNLGKKLPPPSISCHKMMLARMNNTVNIHSHEKVNLAAYNVPTGRKLQATNQIMLGLRYQFKIENHSVQFTC